MIKVTIIWQEFRNGAIAPRLELEKMKFIMVKQAILFHHISAGATILTQLGLVLRFSSGLDKWLALLFVENGCELPDVSRSVVQ